MGPMRPSREFASLGVCRYICTRHLTKVSNTLLDECHHLNMNFRSLPFDFRVQSSAVLGSTIVPKLLAFVVGSMAAIGCSKVDRTVVDSSVVLPVRIAAKNLPNAIQIHERVISGGQPEGEAAFEELRSLGVKTIISVDGATPHVALAEKYGMRYVHLPHGYNGISDQRAAQLAKAVRDFSSPIYIHCHHGKHRSPTAAAVACVTNGMLEPSVAIKILHLAGTSESYLGLYQSAANARRIDGHTLDLVDAGFPEVAELPPFAEAMVELEHPFDHLKSLAQADWNVADWKLLGDHHDLDPAHEALLLKEHFKEMLRMESVERETVEFRSMLEQSQTDAQTLESRLHERLTNAKLRSSELDEPFKRVSANCTACHKQYRDVPLAP